jgi:flagellar secretion chaperone FliS
MFGTAQRYSSRVAAYFQVEVETGVSSADPHQLILMLFDGAVPCVGSARMHMENGEISAKGENISKASTIRCACVCCSPT